MDKLLPLPKGHAPVTYYDTMRPNRVDSKSQKLVDMEFSTSLASWKAKYLEDEGDLIFETITCIRRNDLLEQVGPNSFSGASHPLEPVDRDLMRPILVPIDQNKSLGKILVKSLSLERPVTDDILIHVPAIKPSPSSVLALTEKLVEDRPHDHHQCSVSSQNKGKGLHVDLEEKECSSDPSLPPTPSGNASPLIKGSLQGDCVNNESAKSSISHASDSGGLSDDSNWSNVTGSINKPHGGNDPRWKAITSVRSRDGVLGMSHFRLFKCLGCGDIGRGDLHTLRQRQSGRHFSEYAVRICCETLFDSNVLRRGGIIGTGVSSHVVLGVIYWDIKLTRLPENVLVREDGHIMLSDFDLLLRCAVSPTLVRSSSHDPSKQNGAFCVQPACIETVVAGTKTVAGEAMKKPDETF